MSEHETIKRDPQKPAKVETQYGWADVESDEQYYRWVERWHERETINKRLESEYIKRK